MGFLRIPQRLSLATKFNLLAIVLILATSAGICLFMIRLEIRASYQELLNHGKTVADTTARNCEFGIFTEDRATLIAVLDGLSSDADVAYVSVMNQKQSTLAARAFKGSDVMHDPAAGGFLSTESVYREMVDRRDGRRYTEILLPVVSAGSDDISDVLLTGAGASSRRAPAVIGYLRLGLTQESLRQRIHQMVASVLLFTALLVLLGTGLTIYLSRRITSPLERLTEASQDIAEGRFDSAIEIRTNDEVADLARSFDNMRRRLSVYHAEVEERAAELTRMNQQLVREIDARKTAEEQVLHDALHDALTGLPNRALFMDRLTHTIQLARRRRDFIYAVLFLDIDRFKVINDSLGHIVGDDLLIAIGRRIMTCLRPGDTVARLGGDEFAILLEDISGLGNATFIAERIGAALKDPFTVSGHEVFANGSIGIALSAADYQYPGQVLRDADTAMYQAKTSSKTSYVVFEPGMHAHALKRLYLETDLRRAVERGEFVVFYQPILSLETNSLAGFEALVRWQHPERGLIAPGDFTPMAEETGMIVSIDRLVLRESCRQMQEWLARFPRGHRLFVSVNLSNKQMVQPDLVGFVSGVLADTGIRPASLKLEITENVIIETPEETIAILAQLKSLGVQLYIDDFGTGYSSLSYLHRLPIDGLKIDRSFIQGMGANGENQQIVKMIMLLARDMNIGVIAEGLETEDQVAQVKALHCGFGQGYLFSRPVGCDQAGGMIGGDPETTTV